MPIPDIDMRAETCEQETKGPGCPLTCSRRAARRAGNQFSLLCILFSRSPTLLVDLEVLLFTLSLSSS